MSYQTWLRQLCIVIALASFGEYFVESDSTENELRGYLEHFNMNRHHLKNPDGKTHARDFIRDTFISFGLHTWMEPFFPSPPDTKVAKGVNVVGFLPGKLARTRDDRLILIGSHYDTMPNTSQGADDNGSGVVALLRAARLLTAKWASCTRQYSVMFVAFDFEEWENNTLPAVACTKLGCGSRAFVANFSSYYNLFPNMSVARYGELQGAIIMDTMMNYNSTPNSQAPIPKELETLFPEQYNSIVKNSFRGDFLLAVGRYSNDGQLLNTFFYYYKKDQSKYKLQVFRLPFDGPPMGLTPFGQHLMSPFLRSDHVSFWNEITSNRAIFLSDTANMRSYMRSCYHRNCDSLSHVTKDFLGFLSKSCDTIVMTTDYLTKTKCKTNTQTEESTELTTGGSMTIGMLLGSIMSAIGVYCCWCFRKKKSNAELVVNEEQNWSAANPVYASPDAEGTGNSGTGTGRGTGSTATGTTGTRNIGTGNTGTGNTGPGNRGTGITGTGTTGTENRGAGSTGTGNTDTGNRGTGNTSTPITGTGNAGTGNRGTGLKSAVRPPKEKAAENIYEAAGPESRWNENEASVRRPGLNTLGTGTREGGHDVDDSFA